MYSLKEASKVYLEGEVRSKEPFVFGHLDVPKELVEKAKSLEYTKAKILAADFDAEPDEHGKYPLVARDDEGRRSSVTLMDKTHNEEFWDYMEKAGVFAEEWWERFPQYFDEWFFGQNGQVIKYGKGDFFLIHSDGGNFNYDFKVKGRDVCRVLMVVIGLSDSSEYEGGELEFPSENKVIKSTTGDVLCFPAPMKHLVREVTKGSRHVLLGQYYAPLHRAHRDLFVDQFDRGPST